MDLFNALINPQTFSMALCAYLLIRFETSLKELKRSIEKMTRVMMFMASSIDCEDALKQFIKMDDEPKPKKAKSPSEAISQAIQDRILHA